MTNHSQEQPETGPYRASKAEKNRVNESDGGTDVVQGAFNWLTGLRLMSAAV